MSKRITRRQTQQGAHSPLNPGVGPRDPQGNPGPSLPPVPAFPALNLGPPNSRMQSSQNQIPSSNPSSLSEDVPMLSANSQGAPSSRPPSMTGAQSKKRSRDQMYADGIFRMTGPSADKRRKLEQTAEAFLQTAVAAREEEVLEGRHPRQVR